MVLVSEVDDCVSNLTDLTADDGGENFAYFTTCFEGTVVEDGVTD